MKQAETNDNAQDHHIKVLDGLRAAAVLLILIVHSYEVFNTGFPSRLISNSIPLTWFIMNSWVGVQIFFTLSGFLITSQLLNPKILDPLQRRDFIRQYLIRRFFRLAPAYYAVLTLVCLTMIIALPVINAPSVLPWLWRYIYHLFFMQDYLPPDILPLFWSLAVEAKFYLFAPLAIIALMKCSPLKRYIIFAALFLALLLVKMRMVESSDIPWTTESYFLHIRIPFHMALDSLVAGMLCRFLWQENQVREFLSRRSTANLVFYSGLILFLFLTAGIMPYQAHIEGIRFFSMTAYFTLIAAACALILLGLLGHCSGHQLFEGRVLRWIAAISYSLYLIHALFTHAAFTAASLLISSNDPSTLWALTFFLTLCVSLPCAHLMHIFIEKPALAWGKGLPPQKPVSRSP